jgi:hypothetical protein
MWGDILSWTASSRARAVVSRRMKILRHGKDYGFVLLLRNRDIDDYINV